MQAPHGPPDHPPRPVPDGPWTAGEWPAEGSLRKTPCRRSDHSVAEGGTTWREYGITRDRVIARNGPHVEPALPGVWQHALAQLETFVEAGTDEG